MSDRNLSQYSSPHSARDQFELPRVDPDDLLLRERQDLSTYPLLTLASLREFQQPFFAWNDHDDLASTPEYGVGDLCCGLSELAVFAGIAASRRQSRQDGCGGSATPMSAAS
ncbi:hypothetical protein [Bradyrhizobium sacchari]|uniref:hypothetical protein n=1 Tax=Bradyrhizobium sacchari TaxID=1399419 RepID=UPI0010A9671D|nr:hypothetical protein [Bradyrhizobium sacchari]